MNGDKKRIIELEKENSLLKAEVASLKALVQELLLEIERLRHPKNSWNGSVPPSKAENRPFKTKSLRESDGKKPGGQTGNEGNTLNMTETPNIVIEHKPQYCNHCGKDITDIEPELITCRQMVDIPPIIPQYTEHRAYRVTCSCGHQTEASFPSGINAPIS
ncbi:MAG: IS66 family transposase, partial [Desulfotomaculaceae bacterium]|nr:IS66 family transposase [Desulfotomaculaceae bacterium]